MDDLLNTNLLKGKKGLIMGVANDKSLAYAIAKFAHNSGAELAFTFQGEKLQKRVGPIAEELGSNLVIDCDVTNSDSIANVFAILNKEWGELDFVIHAIAFADKDELRGRYVDTSLENFKNSLHISCYSLTEISRHAEKMMNNGGSILTLTYLGAEKYIPCYNVMGVAKAALEASVRYLAVDLGEKNIRVNAISAGPVRTLAASGIGEIRKMINLHSEISPLKRNTSLSDVGGAALYLLSDLASGVTGEIHYVDSGYNIIAMPASKE